jgi:ABC-2 type transport system ATP-binding protein
VAGDAEIRWTRDGERFVHAATDATGFVRELLRQYGDAVQELEVRRASLEDAYMALVYEQESGARVGAAVRVWQTGDER